MLADFIKAMGGGPALAVAISKATGTKVSANAVYQWPYLQTIPHKYRFVVAQLAVERGVALPPELTAYGNAVSNRLKPGKTAGRR